MLSQAVRRAGRVAVPVLEPGMSALAGFARASARATSRSTSSTSSCTAGGRHHALVEEFGFEPRTNGRAFADFLRGHTEARCCRGGHPAVEERLLAQIRRTRKWVS